jgi:hypothetical protein
MRVLFPGRGQRKGPVLLCVCPVFYLYPRVRGEDTNSNAEPQRRREYILILVFVFLTTMVLQSCSNKGLKMALSVSQLCAIHLGTGIVTTLAAYRAAPRLGFDPKTMVVASASLCMLRSICEISMSYPFNRLNERVVGWSKGQFKRLESEAAKDSAKALSSAVYGTIHALAWSMIILGAARITQHVALKTGTPVSLGQCYQIGVFVQIIRIPLIHAATYCCTHPLPDAFRFSQ